jgi:hypothetical protein
MFSRKKVPEDKTENGKFLSLSKIGNEKRSGTVLTRNPRLGEKSRKNYGA